MSFSKHFLNKPESLVIESLQGVAALNPDLGLDVPNKVLYNAAHDRSKVALICGGGSGHEPAHAGFVGDGILSAAAAGAVFASPNPAQVRRAIDLVESDKGTVIIVKNYTGDILNFGLAKEQYAAIHPEKSNRVKFVIVSDDVAVGRTQGKIVGRRGLAGTVLVYKIAGALARQGASLEEVYTTAEYITTRLATIGVGLDHCHVPGTATAENQLGATEIEIGLGIHNEPGARRISPVPPLCELIPMLVTNLISTTDPDRSFVPFKGKGDRVVLLVNNLGGTSELELGAIVREAEKVLVARDITVERIIAGTFMTSLNMPGFSLTLLLLPKTSEASIPSAEKLLALLDEPASTYGWKWTSGKVPVVTPIAPQVRAASSGGGEDAKLKAADEKAFVDAIIRASNALIKEEPEITRMDNIAGDGDCGLTLKGGAEAVLADIQSGKISGQNVVKSVIAISKIAEEQMGGTSGAIYSIFFSALAQALSVSSATTLSPEVWSKALTSALQRLYTYTRARPPSRTLVDPLQAFVETLGSSPNNFAAAVKAAGDAAQKTSELEAKAGRSAYVEGDRLRQEKIPDPGAWGVKAILEGLLANA
ncbi:Dak1 domain-containing protein [Irpex rosettiformis]|uniref:Dak1 domain-containing protein n=1 Tax=Irpex rosettiformis TaxID=378272 RepID=A0ACB8TR60_9APHY|nr:Dak1 domain-containing protein [Irpex rosettiformis]